MTAIVKRFKHYGTEQQRRQTMGGEIAANNLRREWDEMDRDAERVVGQTLRIIERERVRDGER